MMPYTLPKVLLCSLSVMILTVGQFLYETFRHKSREELEAKMAERLGITVEQLRARQERYRERMENSNKLKRFRRWQRQQANKPQKFRM